MKKKILIVIGSIARGGGAEKIAIELSNNLSKRGYDVTLLTFDDDRPEYGYNGERIILEEGFKNIRYTERFRIISRARKIAKICKKKNINTVISFMVIPNLSTILSKIFFRNRSKIIVSMHTNPHKIENKYNLLVKKLYPKADLVLAPSKGIEKILKNKFSLSNTVCIHNMHDTSSLTRKATMNIKISHKQIFDKGFIYITVGRLTKAKAHWHLIRCFKKVLDNTKQSKLIIIGDGELKNNLKTLMNQLELNENIFFMGNLNNVFPYLKNADCFVFTSLWEGFPNVIIEALSQNITIISTDCVSGPREILCPDLKINKKIDYPYHGRYGILTKPFKEKMVFKTLDEEPLSNEENIFADVMIKVAKDKNFVEQYSKGAERAKDFDVDNIIKKWEDII